MAGAAVDRGVGADIGIVADDDPAELRHLDRAGRIRRKAEAGLADPHPRVQHDPRADQAMAERDIGADPAIVAQLDARRRSRCSAPIWQPAPSRAPASITT